MGFWNIVQEALMTVCTIVVGVFAFFIGFGVLGGLMYWVFFLLEYPMSLMFWILEKMLPLRKEERTQRREPEPPPPPPSIARYNLSISKTQKPIQEEIEECLRSMNDEQVHAG